MYFILFAISILFGSAGALLMKAGAKSLSGFQLNSAVAVLEFFRKFLVNYTILGGMLLYFLSAVVWLYLLTKLDISYVQPILALTYVVTPILAVFFLGETVPLLRWVGIAVVIIGVFIVAQASK